jgi:hypothetical protein
MNSARRATELALILIKAAPLRSAAPGHARTGLRPWGPDPARRAGHAEHDEMIGQAHRQHHSA